MAIQKSVIQEFANERDEFTNSFVDELEDKLEKYQIYLFGVLSLAISKDGDKLVAIKKALNNDREFDKLITWWKKKSSDAVNMSAKYFAIFGILPDLSIESKMSDFIDDFAETMNGFKSDLTRYAASLYISDMSASEMIETLSDKLKIGKKQGYIYNKLLQPMRDTPIELFRATDNEYSKKKELTHAYYLGGLIETSRCFCQQRNDMIWSLERVNSWNDLSWKGKIEGVDVKIALGGYNCRHYLMWIDEDTADTYGYDLQYQECY